jgi:hypothetical protein
MHGEYVDDAAISWDSTSFEVTILKREDARGIDLPVADC